MALPNSKLRLLHLGRRRLALDDDGYRTLLARVAGVRSSRDLDEWGFNRVMAELERLGFRSTFSSDNLGRRPGRASPRQVAKIRHLWAAFTDSQGTDASLGKWLDRQFKVSSIRFLDPATARKAIGALAIMVKTRQRKAG